MMDAAQQEFIDTANKIMIDAGFVQAGDGAAPPGGSIVFPFKRPDWPSHRCVWVLASHLELENGYMSIGDLAAHSARGAIKDALRMSQN